MALRKFFQGKFQSKNSTNYELFDVHLAEFICQILAEDKDFLSLASVAKTCRTGEEIARKVIFTQPESVLHEQWELYEKALKSFEPQLVVPCDERAFYRFPLMLIYLLSELITNQAKKPQVYVPCTVILTGLMANYFLTSSKISLGLALTMATTSFAVLGTQFTLKNYFHEIEQPRKPAHLMAGIKFFSIENVASQRELLTERGVKLNH